MTRDDTGTTIPELIVVMAIFGMLMAGVLSTLYASVKLVQSAPTDTNPHAFGALATAVARLEGSLASALSCTNPKEDADGNPMNSRKECLEVKSDPQTAIPHPDHPTQDVCWVVTIDDSILTTDNRLLECWDYLSHGDSQGDLVAHRYSPAAASSDVLNIDWTGSVLERTVLIAAGLAKKPAWTPATATDPVKLASCAAIRPDQRATLDLIPLCNGDEVSRFDLPDPLPDVEGQRMPTLRVFS